MPPVPVAAATLAAACLAGGARALAQSSTPTGPAPILAARGSDVCVQVDVAGHRAGHLDCAAQRLAAAARLAQVQARSALETPTPRAGAPDVVVGVSSLSGSRLRMGQALGVSVLPQRPGPSAGPPSAGRP